MKGRKLFLPLVAAAAMLIAGCGVSVAQEGTSGEATTAEGESFAGGDRSRSPRPIARLSGRATPARSSSSRGTSL